MKQLREGRILSKRELLRGGDSRTFFSAKHGLIPFTVAFCPKSFLVRSCARCSCLVKDGEPYCPFCDAQAPRGPAARVWIVEPYRFIGWDEALHQVAENASAPPGMDPEVAQVYVEDLNPEERDIEWSIEYE